MIIGRNLINKYYEDEKLYSTGDDYLDDLLEKAFCDGYEYAQREFGRTGLNAQQAKQFFTKTNTSASKAIRDKATMNNVFNSQGQKLSLSLDHSRRSLQNVGNPGLGIDSYVESGIRRGVKPVDLSINAKNYHLNNTQREFPTRASRKIAKKNPNIGRAKTEYVSPAVRSRFTKGIIQASREI